MYKHMDEEHTLWYEASKKFSKREIVELYRAEKQRVKLLKEIIATQKLLVKQAIQRLSLMKNLEE